MSNWEGTVITLGHSQQWSKAGRTWVVWCFLLSASRESQGESEPHEMPSEAPVYMISRPQMCIDPSLSRPERQSKWAQKSQSSSVNSGSSTDQAPSRTLLNIGNVRFSLDSLLAASTVSMLVDAINGFWRLRTLRLLTTSRAGASLAFLRVGRSTPREMLMWETLALPENWCNRQSKLWVIKFPVWGQFAPREVGPSGNEILRIPNSRLSCFQQDELAWTEEKEVEHISRDLSPCGPQQVAYTAPSLAPSPAKPIAEKTFPTAACSRCLPDSPPTEINRWIINLHCKK